MKRSNIQGAARITAGQTAGGPFHAVMAVESTLLGAGTSWSDLAGGSAAALPLAPGTVIHGWFDAVEVTSGDVIAYRR